MVNNSIHLVSSGFVFAFICDMDFPTQYKMMIIIQTSFGSETLRIYLIIFIITCFESNVPVIIRMANNNHVIDYIRYNNHCMVLLLLLLLLLSLLPLLLLMLLLLLLLLLLPFMQRLLRLLPEPELTMGQWVNGSWVNGSNGSPKLDGSDGCMSHCCSDP